MHTRNPVASSPVSYFLFALVLLLAHLVSGTAFGATTGSGPIGGAMKAGDCFAGGAVARTYIVCVEKTTSAVSGPFEIVVKASAGYRDPISAGGRFEDQAQVTLDVRLEDPTNVLGAWGAIPVVIETTVCTDQWGCSLSSQTYGLDLVRPYGYRMLQGSLNFLLPQDFKSGVTNRLVGVKVSIPGRSESVTFAY